MERGSKCENEKDKKSWEQGYQGNWVFAVSLNYKLRKQVLQALQIVKVLKYDT